MLGLLIRIAACVAAGFAAKVYMPDFFAKIRRKIDAVRQEINVLQQEQKYLKNNLSELNADSAYPNINALFERLSNLNNEHSIENFVDTATVLIIAGLSFAGFGILLTDMWTFFTGAVSVGAGIAYAIYSCNALLKTMDSEVLKLKQENAYLQVLSSLSSEILKLKQENTYLNSEILKLKQENEYLNSTILKLNPDFVFSGLVQNYVAEASQYETMHL